MKRPVGNVILRPLGAVSSTLRSAIFELRMLVLEKSLLVTICLGSTPRVERTKEADAQVRAGKINLAALLNIRETGKCQENYLAFSSCLINQLRQH
jgi:hypothetical protein